MEKQGFYRLMAWILCFCLLLPGILLPAAAEQTVTITTQPASVSVAEGETARITVKAAGDGLTYRWYYKDAGASEYKYTSSFTGNTYSVKMNADRDGRRVLCKVSDKYGNTVQSKSALLNMKTAAEVKITSQPKSVTVAPGETAKVSFTAAGEGLTYTWYFKNKGASTFSRTSSFTSNSYSVKMDATRDGRQVYCQVKDKYGNTVKTNTVTLSMASAVKIISQPESVTVASGETAKVSFTASGEGLTYTWYYKNKGVSNFSKTTSFTGNSYSVKMDATRDGRQVYCQVTDKYGNTAKTNTVTLTMKSAAGVRITQQPVSVTAAEGEKAVVSFTASGEGLTYTWYFKDRNASSFSKTGSFTSNTYSVQMNSTRDGRQIYCQVKDKYGNTAKTNTVTLSMSTGKNTVKITAQPKSVTVEEGKTAKVSFTATGEGLTYTWYFKDRNASSFSKTTSFTSNTYSVQMNASRDGRQLYCVVKDKYGNTAKTDSVTIHMVSSMEIVRQPQNVITEVDSNISFTVAASGGRAPYTYRWQYIRDDMSAYENIPENWSGYEGVNSAVLSFRATRGDFEDSFKYRCVVTDSGGNSAASDPAWPIFPLEMDMHPTKQYAVGDYSLFTVKAFGGVKPYSYSWEYICDSQPTWAAITMRDRWLLGEETDTLKVQNTGAAIHHYEFRCTVTDANGDKLSSNAAKYMPVPVFSIQPEDAWTTLGAQATFTVKVTSSIAPYTYKWQISEDQGRTWMDIVAGDGEFTGYDTDSLTVNSVTAEDLAGEYVYRCLVKDANGTQVSSNAVRIRKALVITAQPQHYYGNVGDEVTLRVRVSGGAGSYSYQWQYIMDGMDEFEDMPESWIGYEGVNSAAMSFPTANEDFENGFRYRCVITDEANNSITSDAAGIYKPMTITSQPVMAQINVGDIATLKVAVSGGCKPYKYRWQYLDDNCNGVYQNVQDDGIHYSGSYAGCATDSLKVKLKKEHVAISRCYRCVITDANGKSVTSYLVPVTKN